MGSVPEPVIENPVDVTDPVMTDEVVTTVQVDVRQAAAKTVE
jgi:hypothetical protein